MESSMDPRYRVLASRTLSGSCFLERLACSLETGQQLDERGSC